MASWFTAIRPLARITRELRLIRLALTRLADAADRAYPPPTPLTEDAPEPPLEIENTPADYGRLYEIENALRRSIGRPPDAEEILRAYAGEAEVLRGRRKV